MKNKLRLLDTILFSLPSNINEMKNNKNIKQKKES